MKRLGLGDSVHGRVFLANGGSPIESNNLTSRLYIEEPA